ncbi:hypothetical protein DICPUDRAFT_54806 [Dictyostelium purpureum]|uniref:Kazal-like domain-containing protein n=1 Tax=Dictyostelium purpureum TaxID=5786 RepID=F0ZIX9_DICPU|nr:uncharacterized protein DICPUDRAFT_54806 [Dictyostelium purpureum]EGC36120.1 hypothetical protein DICPUDRAFT_54806 [Dictyostelium purpureum]|eukprot:XP_003287377.1 hypothetical protein DICPUDRAFT_54806 [Dictyostelium purpureum]
MKIINNLILIIVLLFISANNSFSQEYDSTYLNSLITDPKNPCMNVKCTDQYPQDCNVRGGEIFFARNTAIGICCAKCINHSVLDPETLPPKH